MKANLPVGYSMQSHVGPSEPAFLIPDRSLTYDYVRYVLTPHHWRDYFKHGTGPLATPASFEAMLFGKTGFNNETWPDFQIYFISTHLGTDGALIYAQAQNVNWEQVHFYFFIKGGTFNFYWTKRHKYGLKIGGWYVSGEQEKGFVTLTSQARRTHT